MNRRDFLRFGAPALTAPLVGTRRGRTAGVDDEFAHPSFTPQDAAALPPPGADGWVSLFNGRNLEGWYSFLQRSGRGVAETNGYVKVENGLLHIMGIEPTSSEAESGYLATNQEYENVRIRVEYKWGMKRFPPRLENKRDNGLLYHMVGKDVVWPTCVECQIQETDVGDVFLLGGVRAVQGMLPGNGGAGFADLVVRQGTHPTPVPPNRANGPGAAGAGPGGGRGAGPGGGRPAPVPTGGRKLKDGDFEHRDDWNVVEVEVRGDRATQLVNGRIVNLLSNIQQPDTSNAGQFLPLSRGRIGIEIEYAEIWYRRIEVKKLA
jgi:hypothetical protein